MTENDGGPSSDPNEPEEVPVEEAATGESTANDAAPETDATAADLVERVEEHADGELAREVDDLRERAATAAERADEVEELETQLKRKQADFQNYKKRTKQRQEEQEARATEDLVTRLLEVRDNLSRALDQDEEVDIRPGVESTLEEFDRVLDDENVDPIDPAPGDAVDPQRHEVMLRVDSDEPSDTVAEVYRPGYEMGEKVLRPAQVTVSE
ncbi:nucleotide exchange factor GrpE [Halococcus sp. IIIV-5B]|uniref:nucleotide exchange factor GrpE n=1 Tax=Halococcus sp. IIIV-5B TaxID=2321230 RepID=UPI000E753208|nr:nucleotide exchange factor GrpE [Halococcus sp. IIIV-5B]RJT03410.1 nucleotide exchange factor GrpE [Halococcus sp. IIIV-5B]